MFVEGLQDPSSEDQEADSHLVVRIIRQLLATIQPVISAFLLQVEPIFFLLGIHPGFLWHRFSTTMYRITSALGFNKRNGDPLDLQDKEKHVARRNNKSRSKAPTRRRRGTLAETQDSGRLVRLYREVSGPDWHFPLCSRRIELPWNGQSFGDVMLYEFHSPSKLYVAN
jgi:hypothetical protein